MSEKWALLKRKYGSLHGNLGFSRQPVMVNLDTLDVEELNHLKTEAEAAKTQVELDGLMHFVYRIQSEFYGSGSFSTPITNLFQHGEKAKVSDVHLLLIFVEEIQRTIEKLHETVKILDDAVFNPETKRQAENCAYNVRIKYNVGMRSVGRVIHWGKYHELAELTKEKITCLKEATKFHQKVIAIYRKELRNREAQKNKVPAMIKEAENLCKKAEKCMKKIRKVNDAVIKTDQAPNFKDAETFIKNCEEFKEVKRTFYGLQQRLKFITDEKTKFPQFPGDLNSDYTSKKTIIERVYKTKKKRLEWLQATRR